MKKLKNKKVVIVVSVMLLLVAVYLFYSRPLTIQQRYPMLNLDKCTELRGYYEICEQTAFTKFTIDKNSEEFEMLCSLLYTQDYRRSLRDLLPQETRTRSIAPGDFEWAVSFHFEDVVLSDGNIISGDTLRIQYWYGELDVYFDGKKLSCHTNEQEAWAKEVLNAIQSIEQTD